jgi:hypothetical protein
MECVGAGPPFWRHAVRRYVDLLTGTFVVRQLAPWHVNLGKRLVKAPRVYIADSGLLHALLGLPDERSLERHPKVGASWEGFALAEIERRLGVRRGESSSGRPTRAPGSIWWFVATPAWLRSADAVPGHPVGRSALQD